MYVSLGISGNFLLALRFASSLRNVPISSTSLIIFSFVNSRLLEFGVLSPNM